MATYYKNYPVSSIGTTPTRVYSPTGIGVQSQIVGFTICNITGSSVDVSVTLQSKVYGSNTYILKTASVAAGNTIHVVQNGPLSVEYEDVIHVTSSASASVDVVISTVEVYETNQQTL